MVVTQRHLARSDLILWALMMLSLGQLRLPMLRQIILWQLGAIVLLPWQLQTGVLVCSPCTQSRHGGFIFWPVQSRAQYLNSFPHQPRTDTLAGSGCTLASLGSTSLAFAVVRKRMFLGVARAHNPGLEEAQYFTRFRRGSEATWPSYHAPAGRA
jgi:hypothetical protein